MNTSDFPHIVISFQNTKAPETREVFFERFIEWICQFDERLIIEYMDNDYERIRHSFSYINFKNNRIEAISEINALLHDTVFSWKRKKGFKYNGCFSLSSFSPSFPIPRSRGNLWFPLSNKKLDTFEWKKFYLELLKLVDDTELACLHINTLEQMKRPDYESTSFGRWEYPNIPRPYWAQTIRKDLIGTIDVTKILASGFEIMETKNHITIFVTNNFFDIINNTDFFNQRSDDLRKIMPEGFYKLYYDKYFDKIRHNGTVTVFAF